MPEIPTESDLECLQWSTNTELHDWFLGLAARMRTNASFLLREFCSQLKNGDPATLARLHDILERGMREAIVDRKNARFYLDTEMRDWLMSYIEDLRHPRFVTRRIWLRHLMNGYLLWLRSKEKEGTQGPRLEFQLVMSEN